jgi:hypothetical protein
MESKRIDLKEMREQMAGRKASAERKRRLFIKNLSRENFCEILDSLTPMFRFRLTNIEKGGSDQDTWIYAMALEEEIAFLLSLLKMVYNGMVKARYKGSDGDSILTADLYEIADGDFIDQNGWKEETEPECRRINVG